MKTIKLIAAMAIISLFSSSCITYRGSCPTTDKYFFYRQQGTGPFLGHRY